jgi:hypothetical protein
VSVSRVRKSACVVEPFAEAGDLGPSELDTRANVRSRISRFDPIELSSELIGIRRTVNQGCDVPAKRTRR